MENRAYTINPEAKERVVEYLKELIANKGIVGENANSNIELVKKYLNDYGIGYNEVSCNEYKAIMTGKTGIVLNSHVDVVPGLEEQFTPTIHSNNLYGRGASDALGCVASFIVCAQELKEMGKDIALIIVSDEEAGGLYGTKHILENEYTREELDNINFTIVGEPTECFGFSVREKGIIRIRVDVNGKKSHPEIDEIDNSIYTAAKIISEVSSANQYLQSDEFYNRTLHIHPTMIKGGIASNVIPDRVTIEYDIRYAYGVKTEEILQIFEELKAKYSCEYTIIKSREPSFVDTENNYFGLLDKIANNPERVYTNGASDYSYFFEKNVNGVVYGVKGSKWHKDHEYVEINSMYTYIENIINFVLEAD
ncbi:MAG: M20 family metallopeptidase [Nanoarchaeota archaeon]